jgi:hypothetical protein
MKLLSWDLQHGGGARLVRIADAIIGHDPDVIALFEFRSAGAVLCSRLKAAGWPHTETTNPGRQRQRHRGLLARTVGSQTRSCPAPP